MAIFNKKFRIYYNFTDAGGVVYHSNYLTLCEQTRSEFLTSRNLLQTKLREEKGILFVVANANIAFKYPAKLHDIIDVSIEKINIMGPKINMIQNIYNQENKLLFTADINIVLVNNDYKLIKKVPDFIQEILLENYVC